MKVEKLDIKPEIREKFQSEGITKLNPPQTEAVEKGLLDKKDMIIASPTASGKTLIAELGITRTVYENNQKAIYIVPLKALASEKYQDFKERFEDKNVKISVGNKDEKGEYLDNADIVIVTSEKLDSLLRHNPSWIHNIGLVVVDEIHLLTSENRGPTLEVTLTRLKNLLDFQLLGLSATIHNSDELANWLDATLIESQYRPVTLQHGIYEGNEIEFYPEDVADKLETRKETSLKDNKNSMGGFKSGKEILDQENEESEELETETQFISDKHGRKSQNLMEDTLEKEKQMITFCNSRKGSEKESDRLAKVTGEHLTREDQKKLEEYSEIILNALGSPTSQCERLAKNIEKGSAFHHAGLVQRQRKAVEDAFREGHVKSVAATPTLAAGINLPAYRVLIRDLKRYTGDGMDFIPVLEYEQQSGRAGRPKYDDHGEAISLSKSPGMKDKILDRYIAGNSERITSKLSVEPVLRMHTLALVASNFCTTKKQLMEFYDETFYKHQYEDIHDIQEKIEKVLKDLQKYEFLDDQEFRATKLGKRVSELYIDPDSAYHVLKCLEKAESKDETKAISYLFMLNRTTELKPLLNVKDKNWADTELQLLDAEKFLLESVPEEWNPDYDEFVQCMKTSMMMQAWIDEMEEQNIMDEYNIAPGGIRAKMQNADWMLYASKELARMKNIDKDVQKELENLRIRLKHGIKEELLRLVKYDQIGRVRARKLRDFGIETQEDIRETSFEKLKKLIGKKTAKKLKKQVGQENIFDRENILDYYD